MYMLNIYICINAKYLYSKSYSIKNTINSVGYYYSFLIIGLTVNIIVFVLILIKTKKFIFTISIIILEITSLILKIIIIFLALSSKNSKFPMIIIFEIIFFIIEICLNINLFKNAIKGCLDKNKGILKSKINLNFNFISNDENENILANFTKSVYEEESLYKIIKDLIDSNKDLKNYCFDKIYGKKSRK